MQTRDEIISKLREAKALLRQHYKVRALALFGSYARGDQTPTSDIDILVDVDPSIGLDFVTLADMVEKLLDHHVDLVSSRSIKARQKAILDKELIYV